MFNEISVNNQKSDNRNNYQLQSSIEKEAIKTLLDLSTMNSKNENIGGKEIKLNDGQRLWRWENSMIPAPNVSPSLNSNQKKERMTFKSSGRIKIKINYPNKIKIINKIKKSSVPNISNRSNSPIFFEKSKNRKNFKNTQNLFNSKEANNLKNFQTKYDRNKLLSEKFNQTICFQNIKQVSNEVFGKKKKSDHLLEIEQASNQNIIQNVKQGWKEEFIKNCSLKIIKNFTKDLNSSKNNNLIKNNNINEKPSQANRKLIYTKKLAQSQIHFNILNANESINNNMKNHTILNSKFKFSKISNEKKFRKSIPQISKYKKPISRIREKLRDSIKQARSSLKDFLENTVKDTKKSYTHRILQSYRQFAQRNNNHPCSLDAEEINVFIQNVLKKVNMINNKCKI